MMAVVLIMAVFIVFLNNSFGYFKRRIEGTKLTFNVGTLNYELECIDLTGCEVVIPANQSEVVNLNLTSLNKIDTKYELYYEVVAPTDASNVIDGGHLLTENLTDIGEIPKNDTKSISLVLNNTGNEEVTLKLGVAPSLKNNEAELEENQFSLNGIAYQKYYVYDYTGDYEMFVVPKDGYYKLEVWGAQGGTYDDTYYGGYGAYSVGEIYLEKDTPLYIYTGGQGSRGIYGETIETGYNGGGLANNYWTSSATATQEKGTGGGATHIALSSGLLSEKKDSLSDVLIVAAGGGGATYFYASSSGYSLCNGGHGGGITGSLSDSCSSPFTSGLTVFKKATQTTPGTSTYSGSTTTASFGEGGAGYAGGGGGLYGGTAGFIGTGGGSSYIGYSQLANKAMYCYECDESDVPDTKTISIIDVSDSPISEYAKKGNGYTRITFLGAGKYIVKYNANGGEGTMKEVSIFEYENYILDKNEFTKDGYAFAGWSLTPNSNEVVYKDKATVSNIATEGKVITLYAVWWDNFTIDLDATGGIVSPSTKEVKYGSTYGNLPTPVRSGYIFDGWFIEIDGGIQITENDIVITTENLYAHWTLIEFSQTYVYEEENYQIFQAPYDGYYKLEAWGAQGGSYGGAGGKGAYTSGEIYLKSNAELYVYVGSQPSSYNGGYNGGGQAGGSDGTYRGGGGATDFRLVKGEWNNTTSLASRIMVAAGGGGGGHYWNTNLTGGAAGSLKGFVGSSNSSAHALATGGTQTAGGLGYSGLAYIQGGFGYADSSAVLNYGTGGGSGYYGGGRGGNTTNCVSTGGGGSSYVSGYLGCVAITSEGNITPKEGCTDGTTDVSCSYHYSGKIFNNAVMVAGNASQPSKSDISTQIGNSGNGQARITYLGNK